MNNRILKLENYFPTVLIIFSTSLLHTLNLALALETLQLYIVYVYFNHK